MLPASHAEGFAGPKASFCLFTWDRFLSTSLFISSLTNSHSPRRKESREVGKGTIAQGDDVQMERNHSDWSRSQGHRQCQGPGSG